MTFSGHEIGLAINVANPGPRGIFKNTQLPIDRAENHPYTGPRARPVKKPVPQPLRDGQRIDRQYFAHGDERVAQAVEQLTFNQ
jgi:hypothetical protein